MTYERNLHGSCCKVDLPDFVGKVGGPGAFAALNRPKHQRKDAADAEKILPFCAPWGKP